MIETRPLYVSGCPRILYVDQTGPECKDQPAYDSQVLELKVHGATPTFYSILPTVSMFVFPNTIVDKWRCGTQQTLKSTLNCDLLTRKVRRILKSKLEEISEVEMGFSGRIVFSMGQA